MQFSYEDLVWKGKPSLKEVSNVVAEVGRLIGVESAEPPLVQNSFRWCSVETYRFSVSKRSTPAMKKNISDSVFELRDSIRGFQNDEGMKSIKYQIFVISARCFLRENSL
jgi:hypothetical protein